MNKKIWIAIIFCFLVGGGIWFYFSKNNQSNNNQYEASKTASNNTTDNQSSEKNTDNSTNNTSNDQSNTSTNESKQPEATQGIHEAEASHVTEEQISTFTTKIYSKDSARQNNISITCNTLNGTTVKNGEIFSFCNTVGQASTSKGYQKADIFDNNGQKKKGLGGGNCQVSTTLYNAVLAAPSLVVTERHEHSNYVPYIAKGKDAAVAYGSYDLKFRNNSGNDVKILSSSDANNVTVSLVSLK